MRTETTTRTLYTFDELSDGAKEKARDWYREVCAGDTDWSEHIIDEFADTIAPMLGWSIAGPRGINGKRVGAKAVYWSGFWSQGDGACFEGTWHYSKLDTEKLKEFAPKDTVLHGIADEYARLIDEAHAANEIAGCDGDLSASVVQRGHYSHSGCTEFNIGASLDADDFKTVSRGLMRWLYYSLEREYEYQNSVECVDEAIRANGYEFTECGHIA